MKKILLSIILCAFLLVVSASVISACGYGDHHDCDLTGKTSIEGKIVYPNSETLPKTIDVTVTCNHKGTITTETTQAKLLKKRTFEYFVEFSAKECTLGDKVTVNAVDNNGLVGTGEGTVKYDRESHNLKSYNVRGCHKLDLTLKLKNIIPMVPEFGLTAGVLTILGAAGMFFVVRRK
jgi:hypothetical protein